MWDGLFPYLIQPIKLKKPKDKIPFTKNNFLIFLNTPENAKPLPKQKGDEKKKHSKTRRPSED